MSSVQKVAETSRKHRWKWTPVCSWVKITVQSFTVFNRQRSSKGSYIKLLICCLVPKFYFIATVPNLHVPKYTGKPRGPVLMAHSLPSTYRRSLLSTRCRAEYVRPGAKPPRPTDAMRPSDGRPDTGRVSLAVRAAYMAHVCPACPTRPVV